MPTLNPIQHLIDRPRASGLSEDTLATATAELEQGLAAARDHACAFGGLSSDTILLPQSDELADPFPSQWVYCYRGGKPHGLCDVCFRDGHYWGLSDLELAHFTESFDSPNETNVASKITA